MNWLNVVGPMSSAPCLIHGSLGPHESASGGITTCCPAANNAEYFDHRQACAHTNPPPNRLTISSVDFAQTRPGPVRNWLNVKGPTEPYTETAERPQGGHYHSRLGPGPRQQLDQPRDDRLRRLLQLRLRLMHPQRQSLNNTWQTRCLPLRRQFHTALTNNVYYFWQPKAELSPHAHANTKKYIHTNMSNTANVIDNWL